MNWDERKQFCYQIYQRSWKPTTVEAHPVEEKLVLGQNTLRIEDSVIYRAGKCRTTLSKRQNLEPRWTLKRKRALKSQAHLRKLCYFHCSKSDGIAVMTQRKKRLELRALYIWWIRSSLLPSVNEEEMQTAQSYSSSHLSRIKYVFPHSRNERSLLCNKL
jgi:hypothetical protein